MINNQITYDPQGRMKYNPEFHAKQGTGYLVADQKYLIENYESMGPEAVSFALERTINTIMNRAYELRQAGLMPKRSKCKTHKRMRQQ